MGILSDVQIRNLIAAGAAVAKSDGDGLTFTMSAKQAAEKSGSWVLRYRLPSVKAQRSIGVMKRPWSTQMCVAEVMHQQARRR